MPATLLRWMWLLSSARPRLNKMDLNYYHPALTETFRSLSGRTITEVYRLPDDRIAILLTTHGNWRGQGAILILKGLTEPEQTTLDGVMYAYDSPAAASFGIVNWDPAREPTGWADRSPVQIEVKELATSKGITYLS
jgi:hypothetical protein